VGNIFLMDCIGCKWQQQRQKMDAELALWMCMVVIKAKHVDDAQGGLRTAGREREAATAYAQVLCLRCA
jgi:hypothetical protein